MSNKIEIITNKIIEYSFYSIFFLIPLIVFNDTYELFEFNKIWVSFVFTIIIVCAWIIKMILRKNILFQKTVLDIPLCLFFLSQVISTIFSLDSHVSFWGYYSRFNGGLISTASYILLYFAFVSNLLVASGDDPKETAYGKKVIKHIIYISIFSAAIVALWGIPSHFGYDPTCYIFRGTLDVGCWTESFMPTIRIFSTLGQPDWLAAYLVIILPISMVLLPIKFPKILNNDIKNFSISNPITIAYICLVILFFVDLTYTRSKSGYVGFWLTSFLMVNFYSFFTKLEYKKILSIFGLFIFPFFLFFFFVDQPFEQLKPYTFMGIKERLLSPKNASIKPIKDMSSESSREPIFINEVGGTDSLKIRSIVWRGAFEAWKKNIFFGTGVETFAFAYYKYRPASHNLTSEWDYLYNKAHNEYLNFLTTSGIFGLGTHLLIIAIFLIIAIYSLKNNRLVLPKNDVFLVIGLITAYIGIIITNFTGFSVVIINLYFYLIPAWTFILLGQIKPAEYYANLNYSKKDAKEISTYQWSFILIISLISLYYIFTLFQYWRADRYYSLGYNLDHSNKHDLAYSYLRKAIELREDETVFKDELSINNAVLAKTYASQKNLDIAQKLASQAMSASDKLIKDYPNNIVFWKTRVRIFYILSEIDDQFLPDALLAIQKTNNLAPTDAKISYNLGLIYGQSNQKEKAVEILEQTVKLKPNYQEAWYGLGLFAHEIAIDKNGKIINPFFEKKSIEAMRFILKNIDPKDKSALESLKKWSVID
ncbi:MAG: O-antigen ligase family protein [Candidatus Levybacteria bacterium]|nr:O-antigen ligase family protein [Candidatus Levybacteria bacterium]